MESIKKSINNEDGLVYLIFPEYKTDIHKITDNKHFNVECSTNTESTDIVDDALITIDQWFHDLSIDKRIEAVATIFDK